MSFLSPVLFGAPALMGSFEAGTVGLFGASGVAGAGGYLTAPLAAVGGGSVVKGGLAAASIGSGIVGAAGARQAGEAAANAATFNAQVAAQQAGREREAANLEASEFTKKQRRLLSAASVGRTAGSGVTASGSPLLVDEDTINEIAFNEALIRSGGETRATRLEQESALQTSRAKSERTASYYRAGGSLLGSARDLTFLYNA